MSTPPARRYSISAAPSTRRIARNTFTAPVVGVAWADQDRRLVAADAPTVGVFDPLKTSPPRSFESPRGGSTALAVTPDGARVLTGLVSQHPQQMHRIKMLRIDLKNLAIQLLGLHQPSRLMMLHGGCQCGCNRRVVHLAMPQMRVMKFSGKFN